MNLTYFSHIWWYIIIIHTSLYNDSLYYIPHHTELYLVVDSCLLHLSIKPPTDIEASVFELDTSAKRLFTVRKGVFSEEIDLLINVCLLNRGNMSSRYSRNSETNASELLEYLDTMFPGYLKWTIDSNVFFFNTICKWLVLFLISC